MKIRGLGNIQSMSKFEHIGANLNYSDLTSETLDIGRYYTTPDGTKYPSVTTVLSILSEDAIQKWRNRIGEDEANKISTQASGRGTIVHSVIEKYINNEENYLEGTMPHIKDNFLSVKDILDTHIGKVYAQEIPLYSDHLRLAGRVDCVAEWDGKISIIDFKTSRKLKSKENIENYFIQESAYAIMWEERTGVPITRLVTLIAGDEGAQVFIEHRDNHTEKLIKTIREYERRRFFGSI